MIQPVKSVSVIGEEMFTAKVEPMEQKLAQAFTMLTMLELSKAELPEGVVEQHPYPTIKKILEMVGLPDAASPAAIALAACIVDQPGIAMLYAAAFAAAYFKQGRTVTMVDIGNTYFPNGFPTEDELHRIWDGQKVGNVNSVDQIGAWVNTHGADVKVFHVSGADEAINILKQLGMGVPETTH